MMRLRLLFWCLLALSCWACAEQDELAIDTFPALMAVPAGFPAIEVPEDNAFSPERWALGKRLFYDPVMSVDSTVSCASCHRPNLAFSDNRAMSPGVAGRPGVRNSPSLANVAYQPYFTREGGVPTLEMQILVPIQEHNEFDFNIVLLAERLAQDASYVEQAAAAYGRQPDPFVITRALACFERSLLSGNSPFDQFEYQNRKTALSREALRGMDLFYSDRTNCSVCHSGFNFSNYAFENNGLYDVYADPGRFRLTGDTSDMALFKVPGLRNVAVTGPYMHDGTFERLMDVIEHYNQGGKAHPHRSPLIRPLQLTEQEKADLVQFLEALTDESFIKNPLFEP